MGTAEEQHYRLAEHVRFRNFGDEGLVMLQEEGDVIGLNEVAAAQMSWLCEGHTPLEVAGLTAARFEVDAARASSDLHAFLERMTETGVLLPEGSETGSSKA